MSIAGAAEDALRNADPAAALQLLQDEVRARPADAKLRIFLFQLLCVLGQWERALNQLRHTSRDRLLEFRGIGRAQLPSNVLGLLFHAAEHSTRHMGQLITTAKFLGSR